MDKLTELLINCEKNGLAPDYQTDPKTYIEAGSSLFKQPLPVRSKPVIHNTDNEEIFVVSDLHISSGRNSAGVYEGTENFFADDSFYRFLEYADSVKKTKHAVLIINGDIFDFLRVTDFPEKVKKIRPSKKVKYFFKGQILKNRKPAKEFIDDEYQVWMDELKKVGIDKSRMELEKSVSKREKKYGLGTENYKTIYKLIKIRKGHPVFFNALSGWMAKKNKLIILKGNHDLEICWPAVRNYIRLALIEGVSGSGQNIDFDSVVKPVLENITFIDDSVVIDKDFYVEHGHRYDKFCMVLGSPYYNKNKSQINIPFGSFFNRYLINRLELYYPYLDNVRPSGNVLPMLLKQNFPLGLKVMFFHIPLLFRILLTNFRYIRFMFGKIFWVSLAVIVPAGLFIYFNQALIGILKGDVSKLNEAGGITSILLEQGKSFAMLFLSYLLARITSWFQLSEPDSLDKFAKERFKGTDYKISTMGHTHNPGEYLFDVDGTERRFYNTGTWIPVVESSTADVRHDKTYTFLHLVRDENGNLIPSNNGLIQRWNDDAKRPDDQILIQRK